MGSLFPIQFYPSPVCADLLNVYYVEGEENGCKHAFSKELFRCQFIFEGSELGASGGGIHDEQSLAFKDCPFFQQPLLPGCVSGSGVEAGSERACEWGGHLKGLSGSTCKELDSVAHLPFLVVEVMSEM